ncbi:hypothetical protein DICVIV_01638 [Dictyocaulus viviparus]|uniref:Uncharacterized protein n=1 Tax=Dictyocaulus viviparus TaxID=29172 RepID=A0A0D8Y5Q5_DICVI|nr:hypothetical protein DICVIV_01638 [Dictyocaulus viviparus]
MGKKNNNTEVRTIDDLRDEAKELVGKIQEHYLAIEEYRRKDRELWRSLNKRLECLEEVKSARGKRRRHKKGESDTVRSVVPAPVADAGKYSSKDFLVNIVCLYIDFA